MQARQIPPAVLSTGARDVAPGLARLGSALASLAAMVTALAPATTARAQLYSGAQEDLDVSGATIDAAVQSVERGHHRHGPHFRVIDVAPDVASYHIDHVVLPPHGPLDVIVNIRASAQLAGLLVSFGALQIPGTLGLRLIGNNGASDITLASGSTISDLNHAVWAVADRTGVGARFTGGTSLRLWSFEYGLDQFIAVRQLTPLGAAGGAGIYRMDPHDFSAVDPDSQVPFGTTESFAGVWDFGQDVHATVNGHAAVGEGTSLLVPGPGRRLNLELRTANADPIHAFILGPFRAFRVLRD